MFTWENVHQRKFHPGMTCLFVSCLHEDGSFHISVIWRYILIKHPAIQNHKHNACTTCFSPPADWFHTKTGGCFAFIVQVMGIAALHACFVRGNQPYCTQFMCVQVLQCPWPLLYMRCFPFSQNFEIFRFGSQWKTFRQFIPLENSWEKCKF